MSSYIVYYTTGNADRQHKVYRAYNAIHALALFIYSVPKHFEILELKKL